MDLASHFVASAAPPRDAKQQVTKMAEIVFGRRLEKYKIKINKKVDKITPNCNFNQYHSNLPEALQQPYPRRKDASCLRLLGWRRSGLRRHRGRRRRFGVGRGLHMFAQFWGLVQAHLNLKEIINQEM